MIVAIALYPIFRGLRRMLGGSNRLASGVFIVICLAAILPPTIWLGDSLLAGTVDIVHKAKAGTLQVPVILVGAIGGLLSSGVVGLFIGPVVLAIAWELFMAWVREDTVAPATEGRS